MYHATIYIPYETSYTKKKEKGKKKGGKECAIYTKKKNKPKSPSMNSPRLRLVWIHP